MNDNRCTKDLSPGDKFVFLDLSQGNPLHETVMRIVDERCTCEEDCTCQLDTRQYVVDGGTGSAVYTCGLSRPVRLIT